MGGRRRHFVPSPLFFLRSEVRREGGGKFPSPFRVQDFPVRWRRGDLIGFLKRQASRSKALDATIHALSQQTHTRTNVTPWLPQYGPPRLGPRGAAETLRRDSELLLKSQNFFFALLLFPSALLTSCFSRNPTTVEVATTSSQTLTHAVVLHRKTEGGGRNIYPMNEQSRFPFPLFHSEARPTTGTPTTPHVVEGKERPSVPPSVRRERGGDRRREREREREKGKLADWLG